MILVIREFESHPSPVRKFRSTRSGQELVVSAITPPRPDFPYEPPPPSSGKRNVENSLLVPTKI